MGRLLFRVLGGHGVIALTLNLITVLDIGFPVAGLANDIESQSRRTFNRSQSRDSVFTRIIASKFNQVQSHTNQKEIPQRDHLFL